MGADEQFGGYMRHRTILKRNGWDAVKEELQFDFDRISDRNLGRDDRMVADHGRQSRLPYLDEHLVDYVQRLLPWERQVHIIYYFITNIIFPNLYILYFILYVP